MPSGCSPSTGASSPPSGASSSPSGSSPPSTSGGSSQSLCVVPSSWPQSVVVYALSNTAFLATLPDLPGGDPTGVDGVAFPVFSAPDGQDAQLAGTRFVLHPRMLDDAGRARDRLVRRQVKPVGVGRIEEELERRRRQHHVRLGNVEGDVAPPRPFPPHGVGERLGALVGIGEVERTPPAIE